MITQISATLINGVFQPDHAVPLPEYSRVKLTIEPVVETKSPADAWEAIKARLREQPLHFKGQRYTRDEIHERR